MGRGLTLLELVVVLAVLAVLAGVAVRAMDGVMDQGRFEASQRLLSDIEAAILGPKHMTDFDRTPMTGGFVADVGSLPVVVTENGEPTLAELWSNPNALEPFHIQQPDGDAEVRLAAGWRGPYLRLPIGASDLRDGWGNPLALLGPDGAPLADGEEVTIIQSPGGEAPYDDVLEVVIHADTQPPRHLSALSGSVYDGDGQPPHNESGEDGAFVVVRLYGPNDGRFEEYPIGQVVTLEQAPFPADGAPIVYEFPQDGNPPLTIGPRVVRAYQVDDVPDPNDPLLDPPSGPRMSPARRLALRPGGETRDLILPPPSQEPDPDG